MGIKKKEAKKKSGKRSVRKIRTSLRRAFPELPVKDVNELAPKIDRAIDVVIDKQTANK